MFTPSAVTHKIVGSLQLSPPVGRPSDFMRRVHHGSRLSDSCESVEKEFLSMNFFL